MTATTDILPFGSGGTGSPNVLSQVNYVTFLAGLSGNSFAVGAIPSAQQFNKILRQSSFMAAGLANWMVSQSITVPDDGNMTNLVAEIESALVAFLTAQGVVSGGTALLKVNNLSDLSNTTTARSNLGLGSAATHASTDFDASGAAASALTSAEALMLGYGQTWTDVTSSRVAGTTYYNTGTKPITVCVTSTSVSSGGVQGYVNGTQIIENQAQGAGDYFIPSITMIVQAGANYKVATSISTWFELS